MEWKSINLVYWVRYIHIELIDYGSSSCNCDSKDNNKLIEKIQLESNEGKYFVQFTPLVNIFILFFFF